jgi:DNA mismatch endonuclease, patch repair protein
LWQRGARYRVNVRMMPGTPDIVFAGSRVAVFVHGCFWHRHAGCKRATTPKTNVAFWRAKFAANIERDERKSRELQDLGWVTQVIWACQLEKEATIAQSAKDLLALVRARRG